MLGLKTHWSMDSATQEQSTGLLPLDQSIHLHIDEPTYLELDPSTHSVKEGILGDALILLLIHATHEPNYLKAANHICDLLEVGQDTLSEVQKNIISASVLYIKKHNEIEPEHYKKLNIFLRSIGVNIKKFPPSKITKELVLFTGFEKSAYIVNKVLNKQNISKEDVDAFLIENITVKDVKFQPELKKKIKRLYFSQIVRFLVDIADHDIFSSFESNMQGRLHLMQPEISLRMQTRVFYDFLIKGELEDCDRLLSQIQESVRHMKDQISSNDQDDINSEERSCLAEALYRMADYYWSKSKLRLALESFLEATQAYPLDGLRNPELVILNIDSFKRDEVKNFWLDRFVQAWPLPNEVKPELLSWLLKGYDVMRSQEPLLLDEYKEQKLLLQERIGIKEMNNAMDKVEVCRKIIFYSRNHNIDKTYNLLLTLDQDKSVNRILKYAIKINSLSFLSQRGDERVAELIGAIELRNKDIHSYIKVANIYLNLSDNLDKDEYFEKASIYVQRVNERFVDEIDTNEINKNYIREYVLSVNLAFAIKSLKLCQDYQEDSQKASEYFAKAAIYVSKVNELFVDVTNQDCFREYLINLNIVMAITASELGEVNKEYTDFLSTLGIEFALREEKLDPKILHEEYQELKRRADEFQVKETLGEPEVVYSWKIGEEIYKSTDPHVILVDPDQLIYAINDVKGTEQEILPFDEALRKGFMPPNKKGKGLKYLQDLGIIEAKDDGDNRLVSDTIFFNPEGAKIIIMNKNLGHKGVKRQNTELEYTPCESETCFTLPDVSRFKIKWQEVCGFMSRPEVVTRSRMMEEGAGGGRGL